MSKITKDNKKTNQYKIGVKRMKGGTNENDIIGRSLNNTKVTNLKSKVTISNNPQLENDQAYQFNITLLNKVTQRYKDSKNLNDFFDSKILEETNKIEEIINDRKKMIYREEMLLQETENKILEVTHQINSYKEDLIEEQKTLNVRELQVIELESKYKVLEEKVNRDDYDLSEKVKLKGNNDMLIKNYIDNTEVTKREIEELKGIDEALIDHNRYLHNIYQERKGNIRVFCRVRPSLPKEQLQECTTIEYSSYNNILLHGPLQKSNTGKQKDIQICENYNFDRVFSPKETQEEIFKEISQLVQSALDGYKVCIFAYGQTGSGKTYTMEGEDGINRGLIPRSIEQIFTFKSYLENMGWEFVINVSCCEIYMDQIRDLLQENSNNILKGEKLHQVVLNSLEEWKKVHDMARIKRAVAETQCNEKSSRSHCIFQINIAGHNKHTGADRKGALNLIDLAGSERISKSKVEDERKKETISINKSLTALKSVITALITNPKGYIPYKDSVLTHHLQNYLGGDSKTLMFVNISPLLNSFNESSCSLKFATDVNSCYLQVND